MISTVVSGLKTYASDAGSAPICARIASAALSAVSQGSRRFQVGKQVSSASWRNDCYPGATGCGTDPAADRRIIFGVEKSTREVARAFVR